jgi:hypothetical protein
MEIRYIYRDLSKITYKIRIINDNLEEYSRMATELSDDIREARSELTDLLFKFEQLINDITDFSASNTND